MNHKQVKEFLSQYVSADAIDEIIRSGAEPQPLVEKQIDFVCVEVRGENAAVISERMDRVAALAYHHGATVDAMLSGLVVIVFGHFHFSGDAMDRDGLLASLHAEFPTDAKIVHGAGLAACGNVGGSTRMFFSFILPGFTSALADLAALPFGQTLEWTPGSP